MALVRAAAERSCTIVLTHADNPADCYSVERQEEAAALGAYVEHCFFTTFHGRTPIGEIARQIRAVGCDRVLLTTDFGQLNSLYSDEGMEEYARQLLAEGFSREELDHDVSYAPASAPPRGAGLRPHTAVSTGFVKTAPPQRAERHSRSALLLFWVRDSVC